MVIRPPTAARIAIAVAFAISCFAIALFLWVSFGGPLPLKPQGYRFTVPFDEATQLAAESDVRISGVSVGRVKRIDLGPSGTAEATIELGGEYAPVARDTRATLRQKTLLGEAYVELTPGSESAGDLPEGGSLPPAQVGDSVQLDEVFRTFDPETRAGFRTWMQGAAAATAGRGEDLSIALGSLDAFAAEATRALRILDTQRLAVRRLVRDGGEVFAALSERRGQLRGLIVNADAVFEVTARRDQSLRELFIVLPTFLEESRATLERLDRFAADTGPLVEQLRPAARELSPTLEATGRLAPELEGFLAALDPAIDAAPRGFGALRALLDDDLPPLLTRLDPYMAELTPIVIGLRRYRREVTAFLGNVAAASNAEAVDPTGRRKYLRTLSPLNPEMMAAYSRRLEMSRTNPYMAPGGATRLASGLDSFEVRQCPPPAGGGGAVPVLPDRVATANNPNFNVRTNGSVPLALEFYDRIRQFAFLGQDDAAGLPAPPCREQAPLSSIGGAIEELSDYLHVRSLP